jgi:hypothetical protein
MAELKKRFYRKQRKRALSTTLSGVPVALYDGLVKSKCHESRKDKRLLRRRSCELALLCLLAAAERSDNTSRGTWIPMSTLGIYISE